MAVSLTLHELNLAALAPEILLMLGICVFLVVEALTGRKERPMRADRMALLVLVAPLVAVLWQYNHGPQQAFGHMYLADDLAYLLKVCGIVCTGSIIIYSRGYMADRGIRGADLYALALFSLLGQMVMVSGGNLLVLYLGLELMSLSLYAAIGLRRNWTQGTEAAMKYFVLGALASTALRSERTVRSSPRETATRAERSSITLRRSPSAAEVEGLAPSTKAVTTWTRPARARSDRDWRSAAAIIFFGVRCE